MKEQLISFLKEMGRVAVLAVLAYLLTDRVVADLVTLFANKHLDQNTQLILIGFITSWLRALDKWVHENVAERGITRF